MTVFVVVAALGAATAVAWFLLGRGHPQSADRLESTASATASEPTPSETTSDRLYGGADRPAGPDAEPMDPDTLGGDHQPPEAGDVRRP